MNISTAHTVYRNKFNSVNVLNIVVEYHILCTVVSQSRSVDKIVKHVVFNKNK